VNRLHSAKATRQNRLRIEELEDRLTPAWTTPPLTLTPPSNPVILTLNNSGDFIGNASITRSEIDWYRFTVVAGTTKVTATTPTSNLDTVIALYTTTGQRIIFNDDINYPSNTDSQFSTNLAAGTYLLGVTNYTGSPNGAYTLAVDSPTRVAPTSTYSISATNANLSEGNSGSTPFTFTVTRTGTTTGTGSVGFTVTGAASNGANGADFGGILPSGTVNFAAGQTSATITVNVSGDATFETDEGFVVTLSNPANGTLGTTTATGTIRNDDALPPPPPPPTTNFDIVVRVNGLSTSQQAIFEQAAQRWERVIIGDLPDATVSGVVIDDVRIDASGVAIDGGGGVLGRAGPTLLRSGSSLPITGIMEFDSADLANLEASGQLFNVIVHEMGHVLGIGTIWRNRGVISGAGTANPVFTGANAVAAYNQIFGTSATSVPVENTGGAGTRDGHWRESVFQNELMTGFLNSGTNPLSRITVGSLADIGYQVDLNSGDPYSPPGGGGNLVGGGGSGSGGGSGGNLIDATGSRDRNSSGCHCPICSRMLVTEPVSEARSAQASINWAMSSTESDETAEPVVPVARRSENTSYTPEARRVSDSESTVTPLVRLSVALPSLFDDLFLGIAVG
jgi:hypothetical protein